MFVRLGAELLSDALPLRPIFFLLTLKLSHQVSTVSLVAQTLLKPEPGLLLLTRVRAYSYRLLAKLRPPCRRPSARHNSNGSPPSRNILPRTVSTRSTSLSKQIAYLTPQRMTTPQTLVENLGLYAAGAL